MRAGDIVVCVDNGGDPQAYHVTVDKRYVVNAVTFGPQGARYVKVLGDDNRGHDLLSEMFQKI